MDIVQTIGDKLIWLAGVLVAAGTIGAMIRKPLKKILDGLVVVQEDICNLLCARLNQAYDYWMKKGYCPKADKSRLTEMHQSYSGKGCNHLVDSYVEDLIQLPESPPVYPAAYERPKCVP